MLLFGRQDARTAGEYFSGSRPACVKHAEEVWSVDELAETNQASCFPLSCLPLHHEDLEFLEKQRTLK